MPFGRRWRRETARGRALGAGNYGLLATIGERLAGVREEARAAGRPGGDGAEEAPFQHRSEFEPGRRRGEETRESRLKEEKQRFS